MEILRLNVNKVSNLELWCQSLMGVHQTLIVMLHFGNFILEFLVEFIQVYSKFSGMNQSNFMLRVHRYIWVIPFVCKEGGDASSGTQGIVVGKLC